MRQPTWVGIVGLVLLLVAALVVTLLAYAQMNVDRPDAGEVPQGSVPTATPEPDGEPEPNPEPDPAPAPAGVAPAMQRLLAVTDDSEHVLRAFVGACGVSDPSLEVSFDGGFTWEPGFLGNIGAAALLQLDASTSGIDRMMALDTDCAAFNAWSFVGGVDWAFEEEPAVLWYVDPADSALVHGPVESQNLGCNVVGFSGLGQRAIALCEDSTVSTTADGGETWSGPFAVPNAVTVGAAPDTFITVSGGEEGCAGVTTRTLLDGGGLSGASTCVQGHDGSDGQVAIAANADWWMLWVGDEFLASSDFGATWV